MDSTTIRLLRQIIDREIALHRELLASARLRHILLRQGSLAEVHAIYPREAAKVSEIRQLEHMRQALMPEARDEDLPHDLGELAQQMRELIRRIGVVERANWALLARHTVRPGAGTRGVAVWTSI